MKVQGGLGSHLPKIDVIYQTLNFQNEPNSSAEEFNEWDQEYIESLGNQADEIWERISNLVLKKSRKPKRIRIRDEMRKTNVSENSGLSEGAARERGAAESVYLKKQPRLCQAREETTYKPNRTPYYLNAKRPPITSKVIKKIKATVGRKSNLQMNACKAISGFPSRNSTGQDKVE